MREKIGCLWFKNGYLVADPVVGVFKKCMKNPDFARRIFDDCLAHNPFMQKVLNEPKENQ